jgi:hypothetical protein
VLSLLQVCVCRAKHLHTPRETCARAYSICRTKSVLVSRGPAVMGLA